MAVKVVGWTHMPARLPIATTVIMWLLLDRLKPPGWVVGVAGTILGIWWVLCIIAMCIQDSGEPEWKRK